MWKRESLGLFAARVVVSAAVHVSSPLMDFQPELQEFLMEGGRMERRWLIKATTVPCGRPYQTKLPVWKFTSKPSREGRPCSVCDRDDLQPEFTVLAGYPQTRGDGGRGRRGKVTEFWVKVERMASSWVWDTLISDRPCVCDRLQRSNTRRTSCTTSGGRIHSVLPVPACLVPVRSASSWEHNVYYYLTSVSGLKYIHVSVNM